MKKLAILKDEEFLPAAKKLINQARTAVFISSFKIELSTKRRGAKLAEIFYLLKDKARDGLDVRVLTNKQNEQGYVPHTNAYVINYLKKNRVSVKCLPNNRICHAKMIIVDNEAAIIGSHNLSIKSCHNNFEMALLATDLIIVSTLKGYFISGWLTGKDA